MFNCKPAGFVFPKKMGKFHCFSNVGKAAQNLRGKICIALQAQDSSGSYFLSYFLCTCIKLPSSHSPKPKPFHMPFRLHNMFATAYSSPEISSPSTASAYCFQSAASGH